ncbi:hypothetical protein VNO77_33559 [Canavalia gladiata]|uniref:Uncharacterized protein n=1 Tax=Canavalia gladiata TaxID=3824 RepID=A0AAN9KCN6_CANGL
MVRTLSFPNPAFIRKSYSEIETARPRKLIHGKSLSLSSNDSTPGSSTVQAPFLTHAMLSRHRPTTLRTCGVFVERFLPVVPSSSLAVWADCPSLLRSVRL